MQNLRFSVSKSGRTLVYCQRECQGDQGEKELPRMATLLLILYLMWLIACSR